MKLLMSLLTLFVLLTMGVVLAQRRSKTPPVARATAQAVEEDARSQTPRPFTEEEKADIVRRLFASPRMAARVQTQRHRALRVSVASTDKTGKILAAGKRVAEVVVFNYERGRASRLFVDASTGEVLAEEEIRGRPQSSPEEIKDAVDIISRDSRLSELLRENTVVEGGFIVDGPRNLPRHHRFIQIQLVSPDRLRLRRVVVVDLTTSQIASSKETF